MSDNQDVHPNDDSGFDVRCSSTCTRAGLTALLFSILAFALLVPLKKAPAIDALANYISLRFQLIDQLKFLDDIDPCWKYLTSTDLGDEASKQWSIAALMDYECRLPPKDAKVKPETGKALRSATKTDKKATARGNHDRTPPRPPVFLGVMIRIWPIQDIVDTLTQLGNGEMLSLARSASYKFDRSIYNWEMLMYRFKIQHESQDGTVVIVGKKKPTLNGVRTQGFSREQVLHILTLENVRQLSEYQLPDPSELVLPLREQTRIALSLKDLSLGLDLGVILIQSIILVSLAYFWLFQREARRSHSFPTRGTLFSAFSRTSVSRGIFYALASLPAIASALLALFSIGHKPFNIITGFFVMWLSCSIVRGCG